MNRKLEGRIDGDSNRKVTTLIMYARFLKAMIANCEIIYHKHIVDE